MEGFLVEAAREVVGVAVPVAGGLRFLCSDPAFSSMDNRVFPEARSLARSIAEVVMQIRLGAAGSVKMH